MENWTERLQEFAFAYGPKIVGALLILIVGYVLARVIASVLAKVLERARVDVTLVRFLRNILFALLMALVVISAAGKLGVDTTSFAALIAAAGLAIGLALQGSLGNFASGVLLIALRPFKVGDVVEVAGVRGKVEGISIFATEMRRPDNTKILVPNGKITDDNIVNFTAHGTRRVDMTAGIGYDDDIAAAKAVLEKILADHPLVLDDPAPQVAVLELADSSVNFVVRPWAQAGDYWTVWHDVTEQIKLRLDENGISIPFPQRDVHLHTVGDASEAAA